MKRSRLRKGDRSSVGGVVNEGIPRMSHEGAELAFLGASVTCPACHSTGEIVPQGPRWPANFMGRQPALEGDLCACKCDPPPVMMASQTTMFESFDSHQLAGMGFAPSGRPLDEKPHWIKFALNENGSGEGLRCAAHFEDGAIEHGTFEASNIVRLERPNGSPCKRVVILFDDHGNSSGSIIENLLFSMGGQAHG
ncbi:MAG: PAAR domain-containing protein [Trinickia sp.]|jgi:uncharacterized Zn-binding protein involved in type VI secretion